MAASKKEADFGWSVVVLVALFPAALWRGWVVSVLWGWFVVPLGVAAIATLHAVGLSLILNLVTATSEKRTDHGDDMGERACRWIGFALMLPFFALVLGAVIHGLMS